MNYEYESRISFDSIEIERSAREKMLKQKAKDIHQRIKKIWTFAGEQLDRAKISQKKYADKHRKKTSNYEVEDNVWLSTKNLKTARSSKKLNDKLIKPFRMLHVRNNNVKLKLFEAMKIHDNFHVFLFRKDSNDPLSEQIQASPPSVIINEEEKWKIDDILDSRRFGRNKKLQYRASWVGHSPNKKWYDASDFINAKEIVDDFHQRYFDKPS